MCLRAGFNVFQRKYFIITSFNYFTQLDTPLSQVSVFLHPFSTPSGNTYYLIHHIFHFQELWCSQFFIHSHLKHSLSLLYNTINLETSVCMPLTAYITFQFLIRNYKAATIFTFSSTVLSIIPEVFHHPVLCFPFILMFFIIFHSLFSENLCPSFRCHVKIKEPTS